MLVKACIFTRKPAALETIIHLVFFAAHTDIAGFEQLAFFLSANYDSESNHINLH